MWVGSARRLLVVLLPGLLLCLEVGAQPLCPGIDHLFNVDGPGSIYLAGVAGDTMVTTDARGLTLWSLADPDRPHQLGNWASPRATLVAYSTTIWVDVRGYCYVESQGGLWAYDIRDPSRPQPLWNFSDLFSDSGFDFAVNGTVLAAGLHSLIDLTDPAYPTLLSEPNLGVRVAISGDSLVSFSPNVVRVYDIADPRHPQLVSSWQASGSGLPNLWSGPGLVLLTFDNALHQVIAVDLTSPGSPVFHEPGSSLNWSSAYQVLFKDRIAYAWVTSTSGTRIEVVDFSDPAQPVLVDVLDQDSWLAVGDQRLYTSLGGAMVARSYGAGLPVTGATEAFGAAEKLVMASPTLGVLADGRAGLVTLDLADLANPVVLGRLSLGAYAEDVAVTGSTALVAATAAGLVAVDISDPTTPALLSVTPLGYATEVDVSGSLALVAVRGSGFTSFQSDHLEVVEISDPAVPIFLASVAGLQNPNGTSYPYVAVDNGFAFLAGRDGMVAFDLLDPGRPQVASVLILNDWLSPAGVHGVATSNGLLFASTSLGLRIFDLADPYAPVERGRWMDPVYTADAWGSTLVANAAGRVAVVDASDPDHLTAHSLFSRRYFWGATRVGRSLILAAPPYLEFMTLDCEPPEAAFEVRTNNLQVWVDNTSAHFWSSCTWDFGDGTVVDDVRDPLHRYPAPGSYQLTLTVTSDLGASTAVQTVIVDDPAGLARAPSERWR